jgi:uncharacterized phage protein gp47/JayE
MPWTTPTLRAVRENVRGEITASLGRASFVGNSVLRVIADATAALCHLTLRYIDWLSFQFLPDTAEHEWLDRHANIWLVNADGSIGRKSATTASGSVTATGVYGVVVPVGSRLESPTTTYETTAEAVIGNIATEINIRSISSGVGANLDTGSTLNFVAVISGVDNLATVVSLTGGTDIENDDDLRARVLRRIRQPPMGGAAHDYEAWALAMPGVTRAWCYPLEMGIGTVTVRFMMDDLRADNDGIPNTDDVKAVTDYINIKRPVAVKDFWVEAPIKQPISVTIAELVPDTVDARTEIEISLNQMLLASAAPGQTIYAAWKNYAIMSALHVVSFKLVNSVDDIMPSPGHIAVLDTVIYDVPDAVVPQGAVPVLS